MKKHLVSIMIPTYNRPRLFEQTLQSALAQDYKHVEILVCDNSTNDDTEQIVQKYLGDERFTYRRNREAKSKEDNFAPFEEMARGEYLQWLMDDDLLMPDKLSKMVAVLEKRADVTLVTSQRGVIDAESKPIRQITNVFPVKNPYSIYPSEFIVWKSLTAMANLFGEPSTYLFRRRDLTHHYWRAESKGLKAISDVAMAIELLEKGDIAIFKEPLSFYRRHSGQEGQQLDVALLSRIEWDALNREYLERQVFPYTKEDYDFFAAKVIDEYDKKLFALPQFAAENNRSLSEEMWTRYRTMIENIRKRK